MRWLCEVVFWLAGLPSWEEVEGVLRDVGKYELASLCKKGDVGLAIEIEVAETERGWKEEEKRYVNLGIMHRAVEDSLFHALVIYRAKVEDIGRLLGISDNMVRSKFITSEDSILCDGAGSSTRRKLDPIPSESAEKRRARLIQAKQRVASKPLNCHELSLALRQKLKGEVDRTRCGFGLAHAQMRLSCLQHLVDKSGPGLYRTALSTSSLPLHTPVYFEVFVLEAPHLRGGRGGRGDPVGPAAATTASSASLSSSCCGVCIGIADEATPLDKMIGCTGSSVGLHCSGDIISDSSWRLHGRNYQAEDTVGVLVSFSDSCPCTGEYEGSVITTQDDGSQLHEDEPLIFETTSPLGSEEPCFALVQFFINGERTDGEPEIVELEASTRSFHAAVSLYRTGTKVEIRCCPSDLRFVPWDRLPPACSSVCGKPVAKHI